LIALARHFGWNPAILVSLLNSFSVVVLVRELSGAEDARWLAILIAKQRLHASSVPDFPRFVSLRDRDT